MMAEAVALAKLPPPGPVDRVLGTAAQEWGRTGSPQAGRSSR